MDLFLLAIFPTLVALAGLSDAFTLRIPNGLVLALLIAFFPLAFIASIGMETTLWHLGAALAMFLLTFPLHVFGFIGGGDSKLAVAIALWFGVSVTLKFLLYTALAGGLLAVGFIALRLILRSRILRDRITHVPESLPYGIAIAIGAILAYPSTEWIYKLV